MTARLVIARHGNTFSAGETPRRIGARTDLPLTAEGFRQADALGRWFAGRGWVFREAWTGELRRTRDTAAAILSRQALAPAQRTAAWLTEIDHGPDEDRPEAAVVARIGADALRRWNSEGAPPAGWLVDAPGRIAGWRDLFAADGESDRLIVTSNGVARFALLALPETQRPSSLTLRTGAYGVIERDHHGRPRLVAWDRRPVA